MSNSAVGLLLAAGAGRRIGGPKALRHDPDGTSWLARSVGVLRDAGCEPVVVVLGAGADAAAELLTGLPGVRPVVAPDWEQGMSASLRAGLAEAEDLEAEVAVVHLVDLPDVGAAVVARLLAAGGDDETALVRATYSGRNGHPVVIGRAHWADLAAQLSGDRGARAYLREHRAGAVECGDLASGQDVDRLPEKPGPAPRGHVG